jgi:hypothetical protein
MKRKIFLVYLLFSVSIGAVKAQTYELDSSFYADYPFYNFQNYYNPTVYNILESLDRNLYVSGDIYNSPPPYGLTLLRFDSCGNQDMTFQPILGSENPLHVFKLVNDTVHSVARSLSDSHYYKYDMAGNMVNIDWQQNFEDSVQATWATDAYLFNDGSLLIAGNIHFFPPFNNPKHDLMRIRHDGTVDSSLIADLFSGGSDVIWKMEPYDDDRLMVFGRWGSWMGDNNVEDGLRRIHLPSCVIDTTFYNIIENLPDSNFYSIVQQINVLEDEKILVIGRFKVKSYNKILGMVRLNANGSLDSTFNYLDNMNCLYSDYVSMVNTIAPLHDGSGYLIGGFFKSYQGLERHSIAKIDLNGYLDAQAFTGLGVDTISDLTGSGPSEYSLGVGQILPTKDGKFYIAGQIDKFNGDHVQPIFRIQPAPYNNNEITENRDTKVYPNPASMQVFIDNATPGSTIQFFNLEGKLMKNICKGDIQSINLAGFKSGIYLIRITSGNEVSTVKLVINK